MAFDLYAFDLFTAPKDRHDFLAWVRNATIDQSRTSSSDSSRLSAPLKAWLADMSTSFPGEGDRRRVADHSPGAERNAGYRFAPSLIEASFDWSVSAPALYRAKRAAQAAGVGLFEASGRDGAVWMLSARGRWEVAHRADDERRGFG